jgi:peptidyl-prolyl cis-trans isomerase B (cyclophilin B)
MKKFTIGILLLLVTMLIGCGGGVKEEVAVLETDLGQIVLGFYPEDAPNHVANFKRLAREGVYDGVLFHRVIAGFMIQTGDPGTANPDTPPNMYGTGGTGGQVDAEFNSRQHVPGTLSMARSQDPNSGDSQFFICLGTPSHLNGQYSVFGETLKGIDIVQKIGSTPTGARDLPVEPIHIISVKIIQKKDAELE